MNKCTWRAKHYMALAISSWEREQGPARLHLAGQAKIGILCSAPIFLAFLHLLTDRLQERGSEENPFLHFTRAHIRSGFWGTIPVPLRKRPSAAVNYSNLSASELVSICASGAGAPCWAEFIRRFNPVIGRSILRVAIRYGVSDQSLIDDLVQETYLKICASDYKVLRTFSTRGPDSAFGFLKVVATSVAHDFFKARLAGKRAPEAAATELEAESVPASEYVQNDLSQAERAVLVDQIDRQLKVVVPECELGRARTIFWLYYRAGLTASAIATLPAVDLTTKGVESLLFRLTRSVRESLSGTGTANLDPQKGFQQAESL
jgi:RNA polymerase sigma-70 factor (ECF subfamily)